MKIEKISDTQIKFILSKDDLAGKNIKLEDLSGSNDKTKELFQDMLSKALEEYGFAIDDAPLLIEALPVAMDSIMIIVTKIDSEDKTSEDSQTSTLPAIPNDTHKYKRKSITVHRNDALDNSNVLIYSFTALDDVIDVCSKIYTYSFKASSLYKNDNKYYLFLQSRKKNNDSLENSSFILNEYGNKQNSSALSKYWFIEHGETIIGEHAVEILAENFI